MTKIYLLLASLFMFTFGAIEHGSIGSTFFGIVIIIFVTIPGLIKMAKLNRWGWFIAVLLLSPLSTLLYGIYGPTNPIKLTSANQSPKSRSFATPLPVTRTPEEQRKIDATFSAHEQGLDH